MVYAIAALSLQGGLHMQEQLQWPVIPVTIRGAYELFPLASYYNQCGRVREIRFARIVVVSACRATIACF